MTPSIGLLLAVALAAGAFVSSFFLYRQSVRRGREAEAAGAWKDFVEAQSPDAILTLSPDGRIQSANPAVERLFGYGCDELRGEQVIRLLPSGTTAPPGARRLPGGGVEVEARRKDGTHFPAALSLWEGSIGGEAVLRAVIRDIGPARRLEESERRRRFLTAAFENAGAPLVLLDAEGGVTWANRALRDVLGLSTGETEGRRFWELCLDRAEWASGRAAFRDWLSAGVQAGTAVWRTGESSRRIVFSASPVPEPDGPPAHVFLIALEVPRPGAPPQAMAEQVAGGVAQHLSGLLTAINGYGDLLLNTLDSTDPNRRDVEEIRKAGDRAADLSRLLQAAGGQLPLDLKPLEAGEFFLARAPVLGQLLGSAIECGLPSDATPAWVLADSAWLEQVVFHLAANAREAMPDGGRFAITANLGELDEEDATALGVTPGAYVAVDFSDTGHGIPVELRSRVFEPFFTTRRDGKRAGLGLAVVRGVVRQSGGAAEIVPSGEAGTTVRIWLPHVPAHSRARYSMLRKEDSYQSWRSGYEPRFP